MSDNTTSTIQSNHRVIPSDGKRRAQWNWLFAFVWNGIVFPVLYFQWPELLKMLQEEPFFWIFALFPIAGMVLLYHGIADVVDWFRFGEAPLTLINDPVYIGGNVSGYIDINTPFVPGVKAEVSLRCSHHYIDNSRNESNATVDVLWQDDLLIICQPNGDQTRVSFSFQTEKDLPQSQGKGNERHEWNVMVKLPVVGKDLARVYIIPMDKHYALAGDAPTPQNADAVRTLNKQSFKSQLGIGHTEKSVPKISTTHAGKRYYYPASRHLMLGIILLVMSGFISAMTIAMAGAFSDFLPIASLFFILPMAAVGLFIFLFAIVVLFHRLEVVVSRSGVSVHHNVLFYNFRGMFKPSDIADIKLSRSGSSSDGTNSTVWYQLKIIDNDGFETTIADSLAGNSFAKAIQQEIVDGLGYGWQPKPVTEQPSRLEKIKSLRDSPYASWLQMLIPLAFVLSAAYDLFSSN